MVTATGKNYDDEGYEEYEEYVEFGEEEGERTGAREATETFEFERRSSSLVSRPPLVDRHPISGGPSDAATATARAWFAAAAMQNRHHSGANAATAAVSHPPSSDFHGGVAGRHSNSYDSGNGGDGGLLLDSSRQLSTKQPILDGHVGGALSGAERRAAEAESRAAAAVDMVRRHSWRFSISNLGL